MVDGTPLIDITLNDWAPTTDFYEAFLISVLFCKNPLFIKSCTGASSVNGFAKQPGGPPQLIKLGQGTQAVQEHQYCNDGFCNVVPLWGAARNIDHWKAQCTSVIGT